MAGQGFMNVVLFTDGVKGKAGFASQPGSDTYTHSILTSHLLKMVLWFLFSLAMYTLNLKNQSPSAPGLGDKNVDVFHGWSNSCGLKTGVLLFTYCSDATKKQEQSFHIIYIYI